MHKSIQFGRLLQRSTSSTFTAPRPFIRPNLIKPQSVQRRGYSNEGEKAQGGDSGPLLNKSTAVHRQVNHHFTSRKPAHHLPQPVGWQAALITLGLGGIVAVIYKQQRDEKQKGNHRLSS